MRTCIDCKITKPITSFYSNGISKTTGEKLYRCRCCKCHNLKFRPPREGPNLGLFKPGGTPWNKDTKGLVRPNSGSFKKGTIVGKKAWFKKGHKTWIEGKSHSAEVIAKIADAARKRGKCRWCYNYEQWRQIVFDRDNYKCCKCSSANRIHAHHIKCWDDFPDLRFDIKNGITLCISCHMSLHKKGCKVSVETRKKISETKKGNTSPNKTSFKKGNKLSEESEAKRRESLRGRVPWNKGLKMIRKEVVS